ncbi:ATP-dependent DNA helicase PIF1 [Lentinula edodes]|uniref:ATP-dependent DNA helicase n=1 Tax=Lentinula edodes TaxID=5353 RepID=A0A1Q3ECV3_LENED|nr:ATP-dependent DNA helicase PIF1 [Lentinula edodes]
MEQFNLLSYFLYTYDEQKSTPTSGQMVNIGQRQQVGRPRSDRYQYREGYKDKHTRIIRQEDFELVPQFIGKWFPRNDDPSCTMQYQLTVLAILKPWRQLEDLVDGFVTVSAAWSAFVLEADGSFASFLENIQYFYRSSEQSAKKRAQEYPTYAPDAVPEHLHDDDELTAESPDHPFDIGHDQQLPTWSEEDIIHAQEAINPREQAYAQSAMECAYEAGIFARDYEPPTGAQYAQRCSPIDKLLFEQWGNTLAEHVAEGGRISDQPPWEGTVEDSTANVEMAAGVSAEDDQSQSPPEEAMLRDILNDDQRLVHDIVINHLNATIRLSQPEQLLMIIRGPGGTGKTMLINAITQTFKELGMEHRLAKTATSGVAATLINGRTLHAWAGLPIRTQKNDNWVVGSPPTAKKRMRNMEGVEYLIIDEKSMATKDMLAQLSIIASQVRRTLDIPESGQYFGGMNVILCGDFHQFPPVGSISNALFHPTAISPLSIQGKEIYHTFDKVVSLTKQMRVQDEGWMTLLERLRIGDCTKDDLQELNKLRLDIPKNPSTDFQQDGWSDAVLITPRNSARKMWNSSALRRHCTRTGTRLCSCPAEDMIGTTPLATNMRMNVASIKIKEIGNLPHHVEIAVGMKAMVLLNIATEADLVNGTRGTITEIVLDDREPEPFTTRQGVTMLRYPPAVVYFRPNSGTAINLEGVKEGILPIVPSQSKFAVTDENGKRMQITRRQLALTAGYAFTDYKGQGQTIEYVVVDLEPPHTGPKMTGFSVYVALSRSRGRKNIRLLRGYDLQLFIQHPSADLKVDEGRLEVLERDTRWAWSNGKRYWP